MLICYWSYTLGKRGFALINGFADSERARQLQDAGLTELRRNNYCFGPSDSLSVWLFEANKVHQSINISFINVMEAAKPLIYVTF